MSAGSQLAADSDGAGGRGWRARDREIQYTRWRSCGCWQQIL